MKKIFFLTVIVLISNSITAQETKVYFGLGGLYNSFQDSRFSDVQYNKTGLLPELGFARISDIDYWYLTANAFAFTSSFPNYDTIKISNLGYRVKFGYLRKIGEHYIGGSWTALDYMERDNQLLGNNSNFYRLASDIFFSWKYQYKFNPNWSMDVGVDYGIVSFINSAPSFTANFPQNVVDNGEVSFSDASARSPYNLNDMEVKPFWEQLNINTRITFDFRKRLGLTYAWNLRSYADHKGYQITDAMHNILLQFNFISHQKK